MSIPKYFHMHSVKYLDFVVGSPNSITIALIAILWDRWKGSENYWGYFLNLELLIYMKIESTLYFYLFDESFPYSSYSISNPFSEDLIWTESFIFFYSNTILCTLRYYFSSEGFVPVINRSSKSLKDYIDGR